MNPFYKDKYINNSIEYLEDRKLKDWDHKYGMIAAVVTGSIVAAGLLLIAMNVYNF